MINRAITSNIWRDGHLETSFLANKLCIILLYLLLSFIFWHFTDIYPDRQTHTHTQLSTHALVWENLTICRLWPGYCEYLDKATLGIIKHTHYCPKLIGYVCSKTKKPNKIFTIKAVQKVCTLNFNCLLPCLANLQSRGAHEKQTFAPGYLQK